MHRAGCRIGSAHRPERAARETTMVIRRVSPLSVGKVAGLLYAGIGLIIGGLFALVGVGASTLGRANMPAFPLAGMAMGVGAVVVIPILYGVVGAVFAMIGAALYNLVAGIVGGIQIDVQ